MTVTTKALATFIWTETDLGAEESTFLAEVLTENFSLSELGPLKLMEPVHTEELWIHKAHVGTSKEETHVVVVHRVENTGTNPRVFWERVQPQPRCKNHGICYRKTFLADYQKVTT